MIDPKSTISCPARICVRFDNRQWLLAYEVHEAFSHTMRAATSIMHFTTPRSPSFVKPIHTICASPPKVVEASGERRRYRPSTSPSWRRIWHWTQLMQRAAQMQSSRPEHMVTGMLSRLRTCARTSIVCGEVAHWRGEAWRWQAARCEGAEWFHKNWPVCSVS